MWRLNFDVDVISPTPLQHHIHHILFFDDWLHSAPTPLTVLCILCAQQHMPPLWSIESFTMIIVIIWPQSPLIHRQSPQRLSRKPFFYVKIIAHLPPTSFPSPFQKIREKTSGCGGRLAVTSGDWRWMSGDRADSPIYGSCLCCRCGWDDVDIEIQMSHRANV